MHPHPRLLPQRLCRNHENAVFVILNEVKNLMHSIRYTTQILRLRLRMTLRHSLTGRRNHSAICRSFGTPNIVRKSSTNTLPQMSNYESPSTAGGLPTINYLMTLSARASTFGGIVRPICFAALRLMMSSNFVGCSTGKSAGLVPFRILSTKTATRL